MVRAILIILVFVLAVWYLWPKSEMKSVTQSDSAQVEDSSPLPQDDLPIGDRESIESVDKTEKRRAERRQKDWHKLVLETRSKIDQTNVDTRAEEERFDQAAGQLGDEDIDELIEMIADQTEPIHDRIAATFLLQRSGMIEGLKRIVTETGVGDPEHQHVHSTGELQRIQAQSLRLMAIDGLMEVAKKDSEARRALEELAQDSDRTIADYAQQRLDILKNRK